MTAAENLRLVFLILGTVYGIAALIHRVYIRRKVDDVDERVCELRDRMDPEVSTAFSRVEPDQTPPPGEPSAFPDDRDPPDVQSWVSQLEDREL